MSEPTPEQLTTARDAAKAAGTHLVLDWRDSLPEDLAGDASLADIKDLSGLTKSFIHAQKMVGADKVVIPGEEATEDEWAAFYAKLGRPESPEHYEIGPMDDLPEGFKYNKDLEKAFRTEAHKLGANKKLVSGMWNLLQKTAADGFKNTMTGFKERIQTGTTKLREDLGAAFDVKMKLAQSAVTKSQIPGLQEFLDETGAGKEPVIQRMLIKMGELMSEDDLGGPGKGGGRLTPKEALSQINKIRGDKAHAYNDPTNPSHDAAKKEMDELYTMAYPE